MDQGLQGLVPGTPLVSRTILGRTALPYKGPRRRSDGLNHTQEQPDARLCTHASSNRALSPVQVSFNGEGSRSEQTHAASLWRRSTSRLPCSSSREGSEASPSTFSSDETSGLTTPAFDALPTATPELYDNSEAERTLLQLGARWREMTKHAGAALPPEAAQLQQQQITQLSASMRQARMRSTVELLGRKQLAPGEELPLTPADLASRILEALLNVPDQAERLQMLPEALQAPDSAAPAAEEDLETELLWTTPVRLLQAIDVTLLRMQRPTNGPLAGDKLLSNGNSEQNRDVQKELQVLREEVFRIWDNEGQ